MPVDSAEKRPYYVLIETNNAPEGNPMVQNIHYVNNTGSDIRMVEPFLSEAYATGVLPEEIADLFSIEILKGYNADGTDRMVINAA